MSIYNHKSHNVNVLLYHLVCVAKYRNPVFTKRADKILKEICLDIAKRYEIHFVEIGADQDHVHFLLQSVPTFTPSKLTRTIKSITARELKTRMPEIKDYLWGAALWSSGYFINTVGKAGTEDVIATYVRSQGSKQDKYTKIHKAQLKLL